MSNQKLAILRQKLEKWKSHNEVHAKPADEMMYEFLSELLNLADYDEEPAAPHTEIPEEPEMANAEGSDEGGNSPSDPPVLP